MNLQDLSGVGPVLAGRFESAGLATVEAVAAASIEELVAVPGVGPSAAARLQEQARTLTAIPAVEPVLESPVAKRVRLLHGAIPDLAKSKKHAKALRQSTRRMAAWIDDLDRRKIRKRFAAETGRLVDEAKKRTGSKKAAKSLRKHATKIEAAVKDA